MTYIKKLVMHGFKSFPKKTELEFTNGINIILGPNGSGKSARWDTEVLLASGDKKPIGEIVEESLKRANSTQKISDGIITKENPLKIKAFSINPNSMKIEISNIKSFIKREGEPNLYTIKTKTGKEVTTTACHPVMVYREGKIVSEVVGNLKEGDFIATPNKIILPENNLNISLVEISNEKSNSEEFARFLGYIVGDGCIIQNRRIDFVNADNEIIGDYKRIIEYLGFKPYVSKRNQSRATNIYLNSKNFANSLIRLFNNNYKKERKHIPREILFGDKNILANFLGSLFDCDSSVRRDNPTFEYVTMSKELAENVVLALLRFGIVARKSKKIKYASNTILKNKREYFFITIEGKEKINNLYRNIPLRHIHKKELLKKWAENKIISNTNNDLLPLEVNKEIKKVFQLCGIKIKPLRKEYPLLAAYIENRCNPSRAGLKRIIPLIEEKLNILNNLFENMSCNQNCLITCMNQLNLPGNYTSQQIGMNEVIIKRDWETNRFNAKIENLQKFYVFIKDILELRLLKINEVVNLLKNLSNSDIFWDKINKIEKVNGEEYVYDLEIEKNHNFIANNLFVHNSNVSDALCFVLGRLSAKSMRAAKSGNLIFMGTKTTAPSKEASVELIFDNTDKTLSIEKDEISIKRIVRRNGQSIYKINNEIKTRQDILVLLAETGIDPNGFNIILQGEIQNFVRMHTEERREIIEEVSGISIYESRKQKSLRELEKTEEKLKEISAILRERTAYLNNLEKERQQALKFKKLEADVKKFKASIINYDLTKKKKEIEKINQEIEINNKEIEKIKKTISSIHATNINFEEKIKLINENIKKSTGFEQEKLNQEIADIRADLAGLNVKIENYENRLKEVERQEQEIKEKIKENEVEIKELQNKSPSKINSQKDLDKKKQELERIEEEKKKFYMTKSELKSVKEIIEDKLSILKNYQRESDFFLNQIESISKELYDKKTTSEKIRELKSNIKIKQEIAINFDKKEMEFEKIIHTNEHELKKFNNLKNDIQKMDICPLCKNKITTEHIKKIHEETIPKIQDLIDKIEKSTKEIEKISETREKISKEINFLNEELSKRESDLTKMQSIDEKKNQIKLIHEKIEKAQKELSSLEKRRNNLEKDFDENSNIDEKCEVLRVEIQEISIRNKENIDSEISFKIKELERLKITSKQLQRDKNDLREDLESVKNGFEEKEEILESRKKQEEELSRKFKKMISEKDDLQTKLHENELEISKKQNQIYNIEQVTNNLKIAKAKFDAEHENFEIEMLGFLGIEIINANREILLEKLEKTQEILSSIGSVNLRSLEVYESVKKEYDSVNEKVNLINKERENILKIIHEIDIKKKKTFNKTLTELNELFSRNFSQLSTKGHVSLEVENKKEPFEGGIGILVKTGHGKYFDVTSLSGGEQTLVALSLIFAIQEYKPYCFYIVDEIDAALDKRNSERLAGLLKKYMKRGQYIVITHNDEIISSATALYGISMHEGISKIVSLKI